MEQPDDLVVIGYDFAQKEVAELLLTVNGVQLTLLDAVMLGGGGALPLTTPGIALGLPITDAGLTPGSLWSDGGVLTVVPGLGAPPPGGGLTQPGIGLGLPTSNAGLTPGTLWSNNGVICIA